MVRHCYFLTFSLKSKTLKNSYFLFDYEESQKLVNDHRLNSDEIFSVNTFSYSFRSILLDAKMDVSTTKMSLDASILALVILIRGNITFSSEVVSNQKSRFTKR
jgi:hypothetical protein